MFYDYIIYYVQMRLTRRKNHVFSLKLTRLIRTTDTFLCPGGQALIHRQPRFADTASPRMRRHIRDIVLRAPREFQTLLRM